MSNTFNIYCDESCHLENDRQSVMVLGGVWCPTEKSRAISEDLHRIKESHGFDRKFEIKWKKVGGHKIDIYRDFVNYFFDNQDLHFRGWIAEKEGLDHSVYNEWDHDIWYYKMYFNMLKIIFSPTDQYYIYLDIKDHWGGEKVRKLHEVICNSMYDFSRNIVKHIQIMHSYESEIMQLADILIGALSYENRNLAANPGKVQLVEQIKTRSGYGLTSRTLCREEKFNIFRWTPRRDV